MRFTHTIDSDYFGEIDLTIEGDHFGELDLIVDYDYQPAAAETQTDPSVCEEIVITSVKFASHGYYADMPKTELLNDLLVDAALEDYHQDRQDAEAEKADHQYQIMKDEAK